MIEFQNVSVAFGDFVAIPDLSLTIAEGEFFTLLGPSGCGKTTALRTLAGFNIPVSGTVRIAGKDVTRAAPDKRDLGMVFQNYALFPTMSVRDNIPFGLNVKKRPAAEIARLVDAMAEKVGLTPAQLGKQVSELSGGQQQRVAIARALVLRPRILLLDEPLSNLDAKLRHSLRGELKALQKEVGITTVYVTHDQEEALTMSDRIAVFNLGRVEQVGSPEEIYDASATDFVSQFIGERSELVGPLRDRFVNGSGSGSSVSGAGKRAFVRVEKLSLTPLEGAEAIDGRVPTSSYHGLHTAYQIDSSGSRLQVLMKEDGRRRPQVGEDVTVYLHPAHVRAYDEQGTLV